MHEKLVMLWLLISNLLWKGGYVLKHIQLGNLYIKTMDGYIF